MVMRTKPDPKWQDKENQVIAQGALTNSKRPSCFVKGVYPTHVSRGVGPYLYDMSGNRYVDMICGLGSNILGYGNTPQIAAMTEVMNGGFSLSLSTPLEIELAESLNSVIPFTEKWKFLKTGTEACMAAIKIARAATGRQIVLSEGYHGWADEFVSLTPPALGVPPQSNIALLKPEYLDKDVAAVIVEPVMTDASDARKQWLRDLREQCTKVGALLIFDEIITGFRFDRWTVANAWNIKPDLILLGKAISNGMPLAAVGGKGHIMEAAEYFVSSTFAGERLSIASALSVIRQLKARGTTSFYEKCNYFVAKLNPVLSEYGVQIEGYGTRGVLKGEAMPKALFMQEAVKCGLLFGPSVFFSHAHMEICDDIYSILKDLKLVLKKTTLEGELPQTPFAQRVRGDK